jgi:hypothetical protein
VDDVTRDEAGIADLYGADPNYTLGMDSARYLTHGRGECTQAEPCALCLADGYARARDEARAAIVRVEALRDAYRDVLGPGDSGEVLAYVCRDIDRALRGDQ